MSWLDKYFLGASVTPGTAGQSLFTNAAGNATEWDSISGDVADSAIIPGKYTVIGLQGRFMSASPPNANDVVAWTGTQWAPTSPGTDVVLVGDATGPANANTVQKIQGKSVPTPPTVGASMLTDVGGTIGWASFDVVLRPGGVAGGNIFTTWAALYAAASPMGPGVRVFLDDSLGAIHITSNATPYNIDGWTWDGGGNVLSESGGAIVTIDSGANLSFSNLRIRSALDILYAGTADVVNITTNIEVNLWVQEAVVIKCTSTGRFLNVNSAFAFGFIKVVDALFIGDGTHAVFNLQSGFAELSVFNTNLQAGAVTGSGFVVEADLGTPVGAQGGGVTVTRTGSPLAASKGGTGQATLTAHGIVVGEGTSSVATVVLGDAQLLVGQTSADPQAKTVSGDVTMADTGVFTVTKLQGVSVPVPPGAGTTLLTDTAGVLSWATAPVSGITQLTGDVTAGPGSGSQVATLATVPVNKGGTGDTTLTAHGVLVGEGTSAVNAVTIGDAQLLIGQTGADPAAKTISGAITIADTGVTSYSGTVGVSTGGTGQTSLSAHAILLGEGTSGIGAVALADAQLLVGQTSADPAAKTLSGDATLADTGALTLATVNSNVGIFGDSTHVAQVTVNAKGLVTAVASVAITNVAFTDVAAGATTTPAAGAMYAVDTTGARPVFTLPSAPTGVFSFRTKFVGTSNANGVAFTAGTGDTVEDPNNPGGQSSVAGTVVSLEVGVMLAWQYQSAHNRWLIYDT